MFMIWGDKDEYLKNTKIQGMPKEEKPTKEHNREHQEEKE